MTTQTYNDTNKPILVDQAISRGVLKNKAAGRKVDKPALIALLEAQDIIDNAARQHEEQARAERLAATTVPPPAEPAEEAGGIEVTRHRVMPTVVRREPAEPAMPPVTNGGAKLKIDAPSRGWPHKATNAREVAIAKAAKKARHRRKHKKQLARQRHGWANGIGAAA